MNLEQLKKPEDIALEKLITLGKKLKELGLTPCERFFNTETLKKPTAIAVFGCRTPEVTSLVVQN